MSGWWWILRRYWALLVFSAATFIAGVVYEPARWNMITTAWGTFIGGVLAWIWFEVRGPDLQRSIWLRRNRTLIREGVELMGAAAAETAALILGTESDIIMAETPKEWEDEVARLRSLLPDWEAVEVGWTRKACRGLDRIRDWHDEVMSHAKGRPLADLTDLQVKIHDYQTWYSLFAAFARHPEKVEEGAGPAALLAEAALDLCETTCSILTEAELLPKNQLLGPWRKRKDLGRCGSKKSPRGSESSPRKDGSDS